MVAEIATAFDQHSRIPPGIKYNHKFRSGRDFKRLYDVLDSDLDLGLKISTCVFFHMKNIRKSGWDGHPHPSLKPFSTKYPARLKVLIISSISIALMGEPQMDIFGFVFLISGS